MQLRIAKWTTILLCSFAAGWTSGQMLESLSIFQLDCSVELFDFLAIIVDLLIAVFIVHSIEKGLQDNRVEKDIFITELTVISDVFSQLEQHCAETKILSFDVTVYRIENSKRIFYRMWKSLEISNKLFCDKYQKDSEQILSCIKEVNASLTDVKTFEDEHGVQPIKISNGKIYLNDSSKRVILDRISKVRRLLFNMKIQVNQYFGNFLPKN